MEGETLGSDNISSCISISRVLMMLIPNSRLIFSFNYIFNPKGINIMTDIFKKIERLPRGNGLLSMSVWWVSKSIG